ncbi:PaaI family thioesterase [Blattabacterium cuenoti]|uniref:PaaI family thioesterase n=1 Tax=Blattabacterium cuenoti TaxID=1653831 RepID=UPI00163BAA06|nr:hotdog fold thioesterase [Blattabacterium cuenoti]
MNKKIQNLLIKLNHLGKSTFLEIMKIKFIFLSEKLDILVAKMPINKRITQPFGYLHGGATSTLSESVGSSLSFLNILNIEKSKKNKSYVFNIENSINHIRSMKSGILFAMAKILHKGKTTHFLRINIFNEKKIPISFCKMTNLIIKKDVSC